MCLFLFFFFSCDVLVDSWREFINDKNSKTVEKKQLMTTKIPSKSTRKRIISTTARANLVLPASQSSSETTEEAAITVAIVTPSVEATVLNTPHVTVTGSVRTAAKIISLVTRSVSAARRPHLQAPVENNHFPHVRAIGRATIVATITLPGEASVTSVRSQDRAVFRKELVGNRLEAVDEVEPEADSVEDAAVSIGEAAEVASTKASNQIPVADQPIKKLNLIKFPVLSIQLQIYHTIF